MKQNNTTKKLALAGVLTALAIVGSFISVPVAGSKCAPVQHMVNILAAVTLGPAWGVGIAFCASLLRNLLGLGSLMAFPGSMVGALCCGLVYKKCHILWEIQKRDKLKNNRIPSRIQMYERRRKGKA